MKVSKHYFDWADPKSQLLFQSETKNFTVEERFNIQAENLIRNFKLNDDDLILDYGCGVGKHAICLTKKGYNVIGYDISKHYINTAKEIMAIEGVNLEFHHSTDFLNSFYDRFDFVYTIDFPFYYLDKESILSLFSLMQKLLSDEGKFLFGFPYSRENREYFLPKNKWEEKNGLLYLSDERINKEGKRTERYIVVDIENESVTEWIDETKYYYMCEIREFLNSSGFTINGEFENLEKISSDNAINVHFILCKKS